MDASFVIHNEMNLYIFNQTRRGTVFGVGTYIRELTVALKDSGINICVINLISDKPQIHTEEIDGIKHWHFPLAIADQRTISNEEQWNLYFRNVVYLLQLHIKDKNNLIFHLNYFESSKLAQELKNVFACKIVATSHFSDWGFTIYDNLPRLRSILNKEHSDSLGDKVIKSVEEEKSYYSKVDHIICLSNYMQKIMHCYYGLDTSKISVIPNGLFDMVDSAISIKYLRKKWNIQAKEKLILFAGRIDEVKGVVYLIKAFREVLKKNQNCRLIIAGSGDYDTCFKEAKDISMKITFTGMLEKKELHEIYKIADIGVAPSLFEPFGFVAVEMMMHELPIVTTATSGLNEIVDETCGLKIPLTVLPDRVEIDTIVLSEKILYLLQHPTEARQMGENGRRRYLSNYTSEIFRKNMLQIYQSLMQ
jgi:glycosyltransferase